LIGFGAVLFSAFLDGDGTTHLFAKVYGWIRQNDMKQLIELRGRRALVTGGGRGIGRSMALALAYAGASVAVASRSQGELDAVAKEIEERG